MPERQGVSRSNPIAVIDIGSNSGRVVVFERDASSHLRLLAGSRAALRLVHDVEARNVPIRLSAAPSSGQRSDEDGAERVRRAVDDSSRAPRFDGRMTVAVIL